MVGLWHPYAHHPLLVSFLTLILVFSFNLGVSLAREGREYSDNDNDVQVVVVVGDDDALMMVKGEGDAGGTRPFGCEALHPNKTSLQYCQCLMKRANNFICQYECHCLSEDQGCSISQCSTYWCGSLHINPSSSIIISYPYHISTIHTCM